jgi:hypothetical protein
MVTRRFGFTLAALAGAVAVAVAAGAQAPSDFSGEADKRMAAAHESFMKREMNRAAEEIAKAAAYVRKEGEKVSAGAKSGMKKAGDDLDKLGQAVKKGTVKSGDELKRAFAKIDHEVAKAWHKTAEDARKSGKDASDALKQAGDGLESAAKWSGAKLKDGTQASVDGLKKVGAGAKVAADDATRFFKGIGDGIADVGRHLQGS